MTTATTTATPTHFEGNRQTPGGIKWLPKSIEGQPGTAKNTLLRFPYALPIIIDERLKPGYKGLGTFLFLGYSDFTHVLAKFLYQYMLHIKIARRT